jgi:hypothetical protein
MLRGVLGDSLFFAGVKAYVNSIHRHGSATTEDFKNVIESTTGVELDWFFDGWIFGTYRPNYHWSYYQEPAPGGGQNVYLRVAQTQSTNPQVFTMPIDFFFDFSSGADDTINLFVDQRAKMHKLHFPVTVNQIKLDPAGWVLKYQTEDSWQLYIITLPDEIDSAEQYAPYVDTLQARGGVGLRLWSISDGSLPSGFAINNFGVISGTTTDTGLFTFTVLVDDNSSSWFDEVEYQMYVVPAVAGPGDIDFDGGVNVADLTFLVGYLFQGGAPPLFQNSADVDASCGVNVADVTYLVAFLYQSGSAPLPGCVPPVSQKPTVRQKSLE